MRQSREKGLILMVPVIIMYASNAIFVLRYLESKKSSVGKASIIMKAAMSTISYSNAHSVKQLLLGHSSDIKSRIFACMQSVYSTIKTKYRIECSKVKILQPAQD